MKTPVFLRILLLTILCNGAVGCGQKGPLVPPPRDPAPAETSVTSESPDDPQTEDTDEQ